jgi:hypothetical protein
MVTDVGGDISPKAFVASGWQRSLMPGVTRTLAADTDLPWFRLVVVCALVLTVVMTWPLWSWRSSPPLFPLAPLPAFPLGTALIVGSVGALRSPRTGAIVVTVVMAYGMAVDQTRMQPEFISLPLLLWGSLPGAASRLVGRAHLISLWFFAGLHKLVSPTFLTDAGPRLVTWAPVPWSERGAQIAAAGIIVLEIGTALMALAPPTRRFAAWSALALHSGILLALSPIGAERNEAVWPWNVALAVSGFALIAPWAGGPLRTFASAPLAGKVVAALLVLAPLGYYAGIVDAYPAHHLYSGGTARATVYCPAGCRPEQDLNATWHALHVPLPPQRRLFLGQFAATCAPGDMLRIEDPYPAPWDRRRNEGPIACPAGSLPAAHP